MNKKQILERAAALIEQRGWCQLHFEDKDGRLCLDQALRLASQDVEHEWRHEVRTQARALLYPLISGSSVVLWNDAPRRTQDEVVAKLREAAAGAT